MGAGAPHPVLHCCSTLGWRMREGLGRCIPISSIPQSGQVMAQIEGGCRKDLVMVLKQREQLSSRG